MANQNTIAHRTSLVKMLAAKVGFDFCGIAKAEFLEDQAAPLENWLKAGKHGKMSYMENYFDKRLDPTLLVPGAKTVITLLYNYYPAKELPKTKNYHIARYAYGQDYHNVIKPKLRQLLEDIRDSIGDIQGRYFVDSAPVLERPWAQRSGAGWIGKNSLLLTKGGGSYFFIAELIVDLELVSDGPIADYCGTCTRCIDSCPTDAITPYQVDANKCISYYTIELKENESIPEKVAGKFENWIFGCDICQEVCPWNRFSKPHDEPKFLPIEDLFGMDRDKWKDLDRETYQSLFKGSAVKRAKFEGLKRNIRFVSGKE
ncbi:MAG: epoxyqueuosine reductase [Cyclobacteriaceae bacterium]|nr:MAG: epoxyqueuosine reductase [Cyclobacteriaceae bacterium]